LESRLSILMDNFAITGKDLSGLLHIDSSLVSKWRSGKRRLKPNSVYTNQIIKHVMALDSNNQYAKVRLMLSKDYVNIYKCTENEVALFLKDWLTSSKEMSENTKDYFDEIKNLRSTSLLSTYSLTGLAGRRQSVQFFLKYAQYLSPGVEMWCYTTENMKWATESEEFLSEWFMRYMTLLSEDNRIKIIHPLSSSYESLAISMLTWMPMHMTGRTIAYFVPKYRDEQLVYTYYLIRDHLALYNWSTKQATRELNTYITHEPLFVKDIEIMLQNHFNESTRIFEPYYYETKDDYINNLVSAMEKDNNEYLWGSTIPVYGVCDQILRDILTENGFFGEELEQQIEKLNILSELSKKSQHQIFINLDKIKEQLRLGAVVSNDMSFVCGRTISVSHETYVKLMDYGLKMISESDNIKLCLASTDILKRLGDTEIVAKDNTRIHFSNTSGDKQRVLITKEMTVVTAIYSYFEELWNTTPYIGRNKEYVTKQIRKQLEPQTTSF
jgi:hypothetical protein